MSRTLESLARQGVVLSDEELAAVGLTRDEYEAAYLGVVSSVPSEPVAPEEVTS